MNDHWMDLYKSYVFCADQKFMMAAMHGHSFNIGPYGKNNEKSSRLKLPCQLEPNFDGMVLGWSPFRIVFVGPDVHPRWPPSAKIGRAHV